MNRQVYCGYSSSSGEYKGYWIPTYWIPGTKLPGRIRYRLEGRFKEKITELKIKGKFNSTLIYFTQFLIPAEHERILKIFSSISSLIGSADDGEKHAREAVFDVFLQYEYRTSSRDSIKTVIYYGLAQAKKFQMLDPQADVLNLSHELTRTLSAKETYSEKFEILDQFFDQHGILK